MKNRSQTVITFLALILFLSNQLPAQNEYGYLSVEARSGDGIIVLLQRYGLHTQKCNYDKFYKLNNLYHNQQLHRGRSYQLPIKVYDYDGQSIRSTIGIDNWDQAVAIQEFNEGMHRRGLQNADYRQGGVLWVPQHLDECIQLEATAVLTSSNVLHYPVFGTNYATVEIKSNQLNNKVFYLKSGHGGPDPGALGSYRGHQICEDEYAYDVTLRLARHLKSHGATVHLIVEDPYDGIRDTEILLCDNTERHHGNRRIPSNQLNRLNERARIINQLYRQERNKGKKDHLVLSIHVDSRPQHQRQDVFFYHYGRSNTGRTIARQLHRTFEAKYNQHRPGRSYNGTVSARNLYILRTTTPPAILVELGNIQNPQDLQRIIRPTNREALARWMFEGIAGFEP